MITVNVKQGSQEWLDLRAKHFTASECPAMMGKSKYQSRTELLDLKKTGIAPEVSEHQQRIFDKGHEAEAKARPIIERLTNIDFSPTTAIKEVEGVPLLASFDGIDFDGHNLFEHKVFNEKLFHDTLNEDLEPHYLWQMAQQIMVADAQRCYFVCSDGTEQNFVSITVDREMLSKKLGQNWEQDLLDGWKQFATDLKAYEPKPVKEKPQAEIIQELPSLFVELTGEVKNTNLPAVKQSAQAFIDNIKTDLDTDEDFANAEATVKFCDKAEKQLEATKSAALAQTQSIDEVMKTIDFIKEQLRSKRLMLNKLVKQRKDEIKHSIITGAKEKLEQHLFLISKDIEPCTLPMVNADFIGATKNKRTLKSLHDAVDGELASAKIEANKLASAISDNLEHYTLEANGYEFLFNDLNQIINTPIEAFDALIKARIAEYKADQERQKIAEQQRLEQESAPTQATEQEAPEQIERPVLSTGPTTKTPLDAWAEKHNVSESALKELYQILSKSDLAT